MGATDFSNIMHGKTAEEAFDKLVEEACYQYGHGGYSGTIAEKHEFGMASKVPMGLKDANNLADKLMDDEDSCFTDKWGPAGCIEVKVDEKNKHLARGERLFIFFGIASF